MFLFWEVTKVLCSHQARSQRGSRGRQQVVVGGIKGGAIFWAETRQGAGKNLKRQHSQANKKYHEIGTLGFLWCSFRVKRIAFILCSRHSRSLVLRGSDSASKGTRAKPRGGLFEL
jgi:hypothetical protein